MVSVDVAPPQAAALLGIEVPRTGNVSIPRLIHADIITRLAAAGAKAIVINGAYREESDSDEVLRSALKGANDRGVPVFAILTNDAKVDMTNPFARELIRGTSLIDTSLGRPWSIDAIELKSGIPVAASVLSNLYAQMHAAPYTWHRSGLSSIQAGGSAPLPLSRFAWIDKESDEPSQQIGMFYIETPSLKAAADSTITIDQFETAIREGDFRDKVVVIGNGMNASSELPIDLDGVSTSADVGLAAGIEQLRQHRFVRTITTLPLGPLTLGALPQSIVTCTVAALIGMTFSRSLLWRSLAIACSFVAMLATLIILYRGFGWLWSPWPLLPVLVIAAESFAWVQRQRLQQA